MVPQRGWGAGAGHGTDEGTERGGMAASTAGYSEEVKNCHSYTQKRSQRVASDDAEQGRSGTGVDAQETPSPASVLHRPAETSAGCGDSSASAATTHHQEGDGLIVESKDV